MSTCMHEEFLDDLIEDAMYDAVFLEDLGPEDTGTALSRAGFDELTPVDTFMQANGEYIFVTEDYDAYND